MRELALRASLLLLTVVPATAQGGFFDVTTYGAVVDDGTDDYLAIEAAVAAALAYSGDAVLHFPAGQYDIGARSNMGGSALDFFGAVGGPNPTSLRIESGPGGPAEIVMTPTTAGANIGCIEIRDLQDVTLTGLKIDYRDTSGAPTTFSQGTVLDVNLGTLGVPGSAYVKLDVDTGYQPPEVDARRMHAIDPLTTGFRGGVANRIISAVTPWPAEPGVYRLEHDYIHPSNDNLQVGDRLAIGDFPEGHPIVFVEDVVGVEISDFEINAGAHMGIMVRSSTDTVVDDVRIIPGDAPSGAPDRMISTNRDGIHVSDNRGSLEVRNCEVISSSDDAITSHGFSFDLTSIISSTRVQLTERKAHQSPLQGGDQLRFYDVGSSTYETRTIDFAILQSAGGATGMDVYLVKLTAPIYTTSTPNLAEVHVANLETVGSSITFTDNYCELISGRGIMIWGSNGTISNNTTYHTWSNGIGIVTNLDLPTAPGDSGSWDAAASEGVVVSNNNIYHSGEGETSQNTFRGGLVVYNSTRDLDTGFWLPQNWTSADLFSDILIEDNYFESVHGPNIIISNATNVVVSDNSFVLVNVESPGPQNATRPLHLTAIVDLEYVDQISFSGNDIFMTNLRDFRPIPGSTNLYVDDTSNCTNVTPALADQGFVLHP